MQELIHLRSESGKTFDLGGNKRALELSSGIVHYKDNYADASEAWKDIDTTIVNGHVDKAPYILTINYDNLSITFKDKRTGNETILELAGIPPGRLKKVAPSVQGNTATMAEVLNGLDIKIVASDTQVRFQRIIKNANVPKRVDFAVWGDTSRIKYHANDSAGKKLKVSATISGNTIVEDIVAANLTSAVYPLTIDPILTVYPDAHVESTSVDGYMNYRNNGSTWNTLHTATAGNEDLFDSTVFLYIMADRDASGTLYNTIYRTFLLFDTSSIGGAATIDSATLAIYGNTKSNSSGWSLASNIYSSSPASNTALALEDYDQVGETAFATAIAYADWATGGYNTFTLNASGIAAIDKTGISKFSHRFVKDADNDAPSGGGGGSFSDYLSYASEKGAGFRPTLTVVYSTAASNFFAFF